MSEVESRGQILVDDVTKRFQEVTAVDRVTLEIAGGEFFSMLGPSGCGKTTTLRMIAGFVEPTSGRIVLQGEDVTWVPPGQAQRQHGVPGLRPLPAHDGGRERRLRAQAEEARSRGDSPPGERDAEHGAPRRPREPSPGQALRRAAAAGGARARARQPPRGPAARRAARRARPQAAQGDAARAQGDPEPHEDDLRLRHARSGGSAHDVRPHRGHEQRHRRAAGLAAGALRAAGLGVRGGLHRHVQPARPARGRARVGRSRDAPRRLPPHPGPRRRPARRDAAPDHRAAREDQAEPRRHRRARSPASRAPSPMWSTWAR